MSKLRIWFRRFLASSLERWSCPAEIKVINFQINDICNLKCIMCNIWKQKKDSEMTVASFREMLQQPSLRGLQHIGITGGEPTLRSDLFDFYKVAVEELPHLKGLSFITNGSRPDVAVAAYGKTFKLCSKWGIEFNGMVSIDGVGETHDKVRGRPGTFSKAIDTLERLRAIGIPVIVCCTIVKENVYGLHELLEYFTAKNVYVRFRVAEYINRLYNEGNSSQIKAFDAREKSHLVSFYLYLMNFYEKDEQVLRTYKSILSILTGGERLIGCPYQTNAAVSIDTRGGFSLCAPKGHPHPIGTDLLLSMQSVSQERRDIIENYCGSCIHDYHHDWTIQHRQDLIAEERTKAEIYTPREVTAVAGALEAKLTVDYSTLENVVIAGWYGTETVGDVGILLGIISNLKVSSPGVKIYVLSLFPEFTANTIFFNDEPLLKNVQVLSYVSPNLGSIIRSSDLLMMGGGPLMDIRETELIRDLFLFAKENGVASVVYGCGIGPLHVPQYRENVLTIVSVADEVLVRDSKSKDFLISCGISRPVDVVDDPAVTYIRNAGVHWVKPDEKVIRCFLRELSAEYPQETSPVMAEDGAVEFLRNLAQTEPDYRIELWPMHFFAIGGDDRRYGKKVLAQLSEYKNVVVINEPQRPIDVLRAMASASYCVCMRFHSVVFAYHTGVPFLAVDYTAGGKICGFMSDRNSLDRYVLLKDLNGKLVPRVRSDLDRVYGRGIGH